MSKSELTLDIENTALHQFRKFGSFLCQEVSFKRPWIKDEPVNDSITNFQFDPKYLQIEGKMIKDEILDILQLDSQRGYICYEIKISKSDFKSKAIKSFVGNYNYYIVPEELYNNIKDEIPKSIGCYVYKNKYLTLIKKAKYTQMVEGLSQELDYGLIRALNRERDKASYYNSDILKRDLRKLNQEIEEDIKLENEEYLLLKDKKDKELKKKYIANLNYYKSQINKML